MTICLNKEELTENALHSCTMQKSRCSELLIFPGKYNYSEHAAFYESCIEEQLCMHPKNSWYTPHHKVKEAQLRYIVIHDMQTTHNTLHLQYQRSRYELFFKVEMEIAKNI